MGVTSSNNIPVALRRLAAAHENVYKKGLKKAATIVAERLRANSPYDASNTLNLRDSVEISSVKDGEIQIGYTKNVYWRVAFVEYGTIKQPPQHFMERTFEETREEAIEVLKEELKKGLNL